MVVKRGSDTPPGMGGWHRDRAVNLSPQGGGAVTLGLGFREASVAASVGPGRKRGAAGGVQRRRVLIQPQVKAATRVGMAITARIWGAVASKVRRHGPTKTVVRDAGRAGGRVRISMRP